MLSDSMIVGIAANTGNIVGCVWSLCLQDEGDCLLGKQLLLERYESLSRTISGWEVGRGERAWSSPGHQRSS